MSFHLSYSIGNQPNNCLSCDTLNTGLSLIQSQNTCEVCAINYYPDPNNICRICHSSCAKCNGPSSANCTACDTSLNLYLQSDGSCNNCDIDLLKLFPNSCYTITSRYYLSFFIITDTVLESQSANPIKRSALKLHLKTQPLVKSQRPSCYGSPKCYFPHLR
jgi:hypothetical protein